MLPTLLLWFFLIKQCYYIFLDSRKPKKKRRTAIKKARFQNVIQTSQLIINNIYAGPTFYAWPLWKFQVMCWANNLAGRQQEPCIFHIIGAGKPDPLHNCSIVNRTNDSLEVECTEGFDGGQPQYFLLEVNILLKNWAWCNNY